MPNINTVRIGYIDVDNELLSLIGRYCHRIKSLDITILGGEDFDFFREYGYKLEELYLDGPNCTYDCYNDQITHYLEFCPNINMIYNPRSSLILFNEDKEFLPKLDNIKNWVLFNPNDNDIEILSDKYSQTMNSMHITRQRE